MGALLRMTVTPLIRCTVYSPRTPPHVMTTPLTTHQQMQMLGIVCPISVLPLDFLPQPNTLAITTSCYCLTHALLDTEQAEACNCKWWTCGHIGGQLDHLCPVLEVKCLLWCLRHVQAARVTHNLNDVNGPWVCLPQHLAIVTESQASSCCCRSEVRT